MAENTMKEMTTNFGKLDKFEGHDFRRWQKKMHFLLTTLKVVYVLTTPMPKLLEDATVEAIRIRKKWKNDDYICRGHILNVMPDSLFDVYTNVESAKERSIFGQLGSHLRIEESLRAQDSDKGKGKEVGGPSVNMTEEGAFYVHVDAIAWWIDSGATTHVCKDRCWFKTYEPLEDESVLYMGDDHFTYVHGKGSVYESDKYILSKCGVFVGLGYYNNGIIHETTALYTPHQNGVAKRKNRALKEMVNSMLSYSGLSEGAMVRLHDPKRITLGEKGIDCIFVGYAEHSKAYRFYVIELNDSIFINSIIESRDAIFDENHFSSIPRPKDIIPNVQESQMDDHTDDVPNKILKPRKGKRVRKAKLYGYDFQLYLVEGSRDQVGSQYSYCYSIEEDPRTYNEVMQSQDAALWKKAIDDEIGSVMENNTWVLSGLPPGCKPLGCKWIFKRKMKVDAIVDKFKARLVIQGFRQKKGINYFYTYAPVAHMTTIILLLALAAIHNIAIHQMDVKTTFLNGVIICLYVDDMLIFETDQNQVDKTKKFLSSRFSMKDMGEANVILGIKIKCYNKGIVITQSHYIEKILKKFNRKDCSPVITPMDPVEKLKLNTGKPMDQLEYSRAIGCLMYAMTSIRPDIAYAVGRLSRFTRDVPFHRLPRSKHASLGSTIEYEFVALAAAGKEAERLRNLIHEILIWPKPIAPISIRCDSAPTMARAYSQIYNKKSRHLGKLNSMWKAIASDWNTCINLPKVQELKELPM
nr:zinc finger, CCHC-type [Tanacetum cinerariifolium]